MEHRHQQRILGAGSARYSNQVVDQLISRIRHIPRRQLGSAAEVGGQVFVHLVRVSPPPRLLVCFVCEQGRNVPVVDQAVKLIKLVWR